MPNDTRARLSPEVFAQMQSMALEAFAVAADVNHRVLQELLGLSASSAKEGIRACAELQSATVEAVRAAEPPAAQAGDDLRANPFLGYQKSLLALVDGTQKAFRLLEADGQIVSRTAERLQAAAERASKEIQEALTSSVERMRAIYSRN